LSNNPSFKGITINLFSIQTLLATTCGFPKGKRLLCGFALYTTLPSTISNK